MSASGDLSSVAHDFPPTIFMDVTTPLNAATTSAKDVRFIAQGLRKLAEWRAFFLLLSTVSVATKPKLLNHSGHGNVSILQSDIPLGRAVSTLSARVIIKRIAGSLASGCTAYLLPPVTLNAAFPRALMNPWNDTECGASMVGCVA
jgi:hypothetical protein